LSFGEKEGRMWDKKKAPSWSSFPSWSPTNQNEKWETGGREEKRMKKIKHGCGCKCKTAEQNTQIHPRLRIFFFSFKN
jgi:hypothetical protein